MASPAFTWSDSGGYYHKAKFRELTGARSGKVYHRFTLAACNGRQLGGAYGAREGDTAPAGYGPCPRCFRETDQAMREPGTAI